MELARMTLTETRDLLASGKVSPREVVDDVLAAIEAKDGGLGAYLSVDADGARAAADAADTSLPLAGAPVAIKDLITVKGQPCWCGSKMLEGKFVSPYDAGAMVRLKAAGGIPLGRTNMDEFAMGSSNENSGIKVARNPWDTDRVPGGSSGGSAVAVAANEAVAALGSDTGGSIRQPAALCGCVGLKPSYGRVSRYGLVAFASSLDQIGPITKTVGDAALLLGVIAGHDAADSTSLKEAVPDYLAGLENGVKGMRVGLPKEYFIDGIHPGIREKVDAAVKGLEAQGAEVVEISLPHTEYAVATYYIIATAEASANLARFDGVRYGHRAEKPEGLLDHYGRSREEGFGPEVKRRIILGTWVLSSGYSDKYYHQAQKVRTLIRRDFEEAFAKVDVIASPTSPIPAWKIGEKVDDPLKMYLADVFTIASNLAGNCGISVPCGTVLEEGKALPVGLQLLGPAFGEVTILKAARAVERENENW